MKLTFAVFAIMKDEAHVIKEWIAHYLSEGADHIHLIDNGSSDNFMEVIKPYRHRVFVYHDYVPHRQREHYNNYFFPLATQYDWCLCCDLDEFMYARNGFKTVKELLKHVDPAVSSISVPWKMFGSSGHIQQPESVLSSFTQRGSQDNHINGMIEPGMILCKTLFRGPSLESFDVHSQFTRTGTAVDACLLPLNTHSDSRFIETSEEKLIGAFLHLNHYAIQSYHWFMSVKATRGDVLGQGADFVRNKDYFRQYDYVDVEDSELAQKHQSAPGRAS